MGYLITSFLAFIALVTGASITVENDPTFRQVVDYGTAIHDLSYERGYDVSGPGWVIDGVTIDWEIDGQVVRPCGVLYPNLMVTPTLVTRSYSVRLYDCDLDRDRRARTARHEYGHYLDLLHNGKADGSLCGYILDPQDGTYGDRPGERCASDFADGLFVP